MTESSNRYRDHPRWPQIDRLLDPWRRVDVPAIARQFGEDGVLHSMMGTPMRGQTVIEKILTKHLAHLVSIEFEIRTMAFDGDVLMFERWDHMTTTEGVHSMPIVGVVEFDGERVRQWREYFDLNQSRELQAAAHAHQRA